MHLSRLMMILAVSCLTACDFGYGVSRMSPSSFAIDDGAVEAIAASMKQKGAHAFVGQIDGYVWVEVWEGDAVAALGSSEFGPYLSSSWINWVPPTSVLVRSIELQRELLAELRTVVKDAPPFSSWRVEWGRIPANVVAAVYEQLMLEDSGNGK